MKPRDKKSDEKYDRLDKMVSKYKKGRQKIAPYFAKRIEDINKKVRSMTSWKMIEFVSHMLCMSKSS